MFIDEISQGAQTSVAITNIDRDHTIEATFTMNTFTVFTNVVGETYGSISPEGGTYNYGESPGFSIIPETTRHPNGEIVNVTVDGVSKGNINYVEIPNINEDHSITAQFRQSEFYLSIEDVGDTDHGTIEYPGQGWYQRDTTTYYTVIPDPGNRIDRIEIWRNTTPGSTLYKTITPLPGTYSDTVTHWNSFTIKVYFVPE